MPPTNVAFLSLHDAHTNLLVTAEPAAARVGSNLQPYGGDEGGVPMPNELPAEGIAVRADVSLSYGATLVSRDGTSTVERNGDVLFELGSGSFVVSYDSDIVTRSDADGRAAAYDLRHSRARRLPQKGCDVADRHGPSWFLTCVDGRGRSRLVRWRPGGTTKVLAVPPDGGAWSGVMV